MTRRVRLPIALTLALIAGSTSAVASYRPETSARVDESGAAFLAPAQPGEPRIERGSLRRGDTTLRSGEFFDTYEIRLQRGQRLRASLESDDFDAYLIVVDPDDEQHENDDAEEGSTNSMVEVEAARSGRFEVMVTSYEEGERGDYVLTLEVLDEDEPDRPARPSRPARPDPEQPEAPRRGDRPSRAVLDESGSLRRGDEELVSGEFFDRYRFEGREGQQVVIRLEADGFDPYVILVEPSEEQQENDDWEESREISQIEYVLAESGTHEVLVTSYEEGETGSYRLTVTLGDAVDPDAPEPERPARPDPDRPDRAVRPNPDRQREASPVSGAESITVEQGELEDGDETLESGEFVDEYAFTAAAGQHVVVRVNSDDFDTYVIVHPPEGEQLDNDDYNGSTSTSLIETTATASGEWRVSVTSFEEGETGGYEVTMSVSNSAQFYDREQAEAISNSSGSASGSLDEDDLRRFTGEFADVYTFDGVPGRFYTVEVEGQDRALDTMLLLDREGGANLMNDDYEGSTQRSRLQFLVTQPGPVDLIVSSFEIGETGRYNIELSSQDSPPDYHHEPSVTPGRIFGVFAGITDYSERGQTNLDYCANDARRAFDAAVEGLGMDPADGILLQDGDATVDAFESAIESLGDRLDYDDVLIVFYSGHGGQTERSELQPFDPDMLDEILVLADEDLTDDSLDQTLRSVARGTVLLVLDSCNSGGFAKDVISRPGRMGLFASAEDCLSVVAPEREAGGYLSDFFVECIGTGRADADTNNNGEMTVIEMCQFIAERYRTEVTSDSKPPTTPRLYERTISPTEYRGYQQLLIDRGSIGPHEVLFGW
jgi:hypothetical protein